MKARPRDPRPQCRQQAGRGAAKAVAAVLACLFFAGILAYVAEVIRPSLLYSCQGIFHQYLHFEWDWAFLKDRGRLPGGPVALLAGMLKQWYYHDLAGAVAITAVLAVLFVGVYGLSRSQAVRYPLFIAFVPVAVGLVMYGRYDDPLQWLLSSVAAVWIVLVHALLPGGPIWLAAATGGILIWVCYVLAGGTAAIALIMICTGPNLIRRGPYWALACAAAGVVTSAWTGIWYHAIEPAEALTVGTVFDRSALPWMDRTGILLAAALYASIIIGPIYRFFWPGTRRLLLKVLPSRVDLRIPSSWAGWASMAGVVLMCCLAMGSARLGTRYQLAMNKAGLVGDWNAVLALADKVKGRYAFTPASIFEIDRALAHMGLLGERMFSYPQDPRILALFSLEGMGQGLRFTRQLGMHMDIGDLNAAEQDAYELLETQGPVPFVLEAMAVIHMAKGQYEAARVPLNRLLHVPGSGRFAKDWLKRLDDPGQLDACGPVGRLRRLRPSSDRVVKDRLFDQYLLDLLDEHPDNRLALDYLMGYYLLTKQDDRIASSIQRLKAAGYGSLPRHCQEAVLIYTDRTRRQVDLEGLYAGPSVARTFEAFNAAARAARTDLAGSAGRLAREFGDTYMYYYIFGMSGLR